MWRDVAKLLIKTKFLYMEFKINFASVEQIVEEARNGRAFIIIDDEDRENEGDIMISAKHITSEIVNTMKKAGGLVCVAIDSQILQQFNLQMHPRVNIEPLETAFTYSVDASRGIQTGMSSADRANTIRKIADPQCNFHDLKSPGHVFPILAREKGLAERRGHTEAAIEIAKMANIPRAMAICEIVNEDGSMAKGHDIQKFSEKYNMKISTVQLLAEHLNTQNSC